MTQNPEASAADLRDVLGPIWRRKWLTIAIVVVSTVATYTASNARAERFKSTTQVFVSNSQIESVVGGGDAGGTDRATLDQATILLSRPVTEAVRRRLKLRESVGSLVSSVTATPSSGSNFVAVTAVRGSPTEAAAVANAYAQEYIRNRGEQLSRDAESAIARIRDQLASLPPGRSTAAQRQDLAQTVRQLQATRAVAPLRTRQTDLAPIPAQAFSPRPRRDAFFALAVSIVLALALAFGLERLDRRIKRLDEISDIYDAPLLSTIPHTTTPTAFAAGKAIVPDVLLEPFRELRTHLQLATLDDSVSHIAVTSAVSGEGKSTIVRNLALTYREWGLSVVVVEADLRKPSLGGLFHVEPSRSFGLTSVLTGEVSLAEALVQVEFETAGLEYLQKLRTGSPGADERAAISDTKVRGLALLQSGPTPPNPQAVLASEKTRLLMAELKQRFDIVLVDTPPLLAVSDAVPLLGGAEGVVIVARVGMTERSAAERLMTTVRRDPTVRVLGVVANDLSREPGSGYGYGYGYGAYASANGARASDS